MSEEMDLPGGWVRTTLGAVAAINPGHNTLALPDDTPVSFVPMAAVEAGTGRMDGSIQRALGQVRRGYTAFQEGDVLFAKITPCMENGKTAVARSLVSGIGFGSTEFHVFRPATGVNEQLLYYYLSQDSLRQAARTSMTGTAGQLRVPASYFTDLSYPLPPLVEQQRIVAAIEQQFTRLDAGVAALKSAQTRLKRYRAAVLKAAVEGKLTETWRAEHPDTEPAPVLLQRILAERHARWEADLRAKGKDPAKVRYEEPAAPDTTDLPELTEEWCWTSLEQLTSIVRPICYGILMPKDDIPDGVPYVKVKDFKNDRIDVEGLSRTAPEIAAAYARASLKSGDLLLAIRGTYGRVAEVPDELDGGNITQDTARLDVSESINRHYIATHLRSSPSQKFFRQVSRGVAVKGVNIGDVKLTPIALPPLAEQEQIVAEVERRLSVVSELETTVEANLKRAKRLRQSILREAFAGRLVPQDSNDEPASVLLDRIRREHETLAGNNGKARKNGREEPAPDLRLDERTIQVQAEQVSLWNE